MVTKIVKETLKINPLIHKPKENELVDFADTVYLKTREGKIYLSRVEIKR